MLRLVNEEVTGNKKLLEGDLEKLFSSVSGGAGMGTPCTLPLFYRQIL